MGTYAGNLIVKKNFNTMIFFKDGAPSEHLQKLVMPVVDLVTCKSEAPENFKDFVLGDKICVGYKSTVSKVGVCSGDSGLNSFNYFIKVLKFFDFRRWTCYT